MSPSLIMPPSTPSLISSRHAFSNDVVPDPPMIGTRISGILHKWVNCGKRWKPRWFVLQDGVLSYYKIHGCDNIVVSKETDTICRVSGSHLPHHRKPLGELHLKVSSIHESESDERRFSIFTGTKILHLKANTREDQMEWMEALKAVKQMFPRMSNKELMNSISVTVSTEKLRTRLMKEGVNEEIVDDAERIMRTEFLEIENQLVLVQEKLRVLIDKLGKL